MSGLKGFPAIILCLTLALMALAGAAWTACTSVNYYCDNNTAVVGGSGSSNQPAILAYNNGGWMAIAANANTNSISAIDATNNGTGSGIAARSQGSAVFGQGLGPEGIGVVGTSANSNAGIFQISNATNTNWALVGRNLKGIGVFGEGKAAGVYGKATIYGVQGLSVSGNGGYFTNTSATTTKSALKAQTKGKGWAGEFRATGLTSQGVYIKTAGGQGLVVEGGTKDAVVPTSQGKRALYAEEASEVYFSEYGFGKLKDGKAVIKIDPLFAETVNLNQDYFVFVQPYAKAELFVSQTGPTSFEVSLNVGATDARFAYRLVAKRKGFETARLEVVSCPSDHDPGPYAEKPKAEASGLSLAQACQE
ncbi:MAG: hypothetical protein C4567_10245 [Deltaproteobacteria bacterium]|nr:MAG: hypothetical protein C4567_10245 [Deltaproteobacteria bacterium]